MSIKHALISQLRKENTKYISEHRDNVLKAWNSIRDNQEFRDFLIDYLNDSNIQPIIDQLDKDINEHDMSKFSPEEYEAYRKHFYPVDDKEKEESEEEFERAWKHHYTHNLHHWNWYHENNCEDSMPIINVIHMWCDWEAMGYKFNPKTADYWENNKKKIFLGKEQEKFLLLMIEKFSK